MSAATCLTEKRVSGSTTLTTSYTYDGASGLSTVTYPSWRGLYYTPNSAMVHHRRVGHPQRRQRDDARIIHRFMEPFGRLDEPYESGSSSKP